MSTELLDRRPSAHSDLSVVAPSWLSGATLMEAINQDPLRLWIRLNKGQPEEYVEEVTFYVKAVWRPDACVAHGFIRRADGSCWIAEFQYQEGQPLAGKMGLIWQLTAELVRTLFQD